MSVKIKKLKENWFARGHSSLTVNHKIREIFGICVIYSPFLVHLYVYADYHLDLGRLSHFAFLYLILIELIFAMYLTAYFKYSIFRKWLHLCQFLTFPVYFALNFVAEVFIVVVPVALSSILYIFGFIFFAFVLIGIVGVILFGFRQILYLLH